MPGDYTSVDYTTDFLVDYSTGLVATGDPTGGSVSVDPDPTLTPTL